MESEWSTLTPKPDCALAILYNAARSALRARVAAERPLELRHLVERVAEQPLGHAEVAKLLHAAARPHLGGVVGHEAAALREEPPVASCLRRLEQRHGARRPDALQQRLRA